MRRLRVGMIGAGRIADLHYRAYCDCPRAELVWVCAHDPDQARARAAEWGVPRWTADYRELLADPSIDMVEINTPHQLHHPMVLAAAAAGKHVALQKPFGMDVRECREMVDACDRAGVRLKVMENFVFYPPYRKARELVQAGAIGRPLSIRLRIGAGGSGGWWVPLDTWLWRLAETDRGGGPTVFDDGWHKFSLGLFLGRPVEQVFAWIDRSFSLIDAPAVITWIAEEGFTGCIDATFSPNLNVPSPYYAADERVELTGSRGVIHLTRCTGRLLEEPALQLIANGVRTCFEGVETDWQTSFTGSIRHYVDCLLDGGEPSLSGGEALAVQRFCLAAIRSAREGRPVRPEDVA